jgi:Rrf2 family protein
MLQISTKFRYSLRSLVELVLQGSDENISLRVLSEKQDISRKYLEIIYKMLEKDGIVRGVRGAGGGYQLCVSPGNLTLMQVFNAVEGPIKLLECIDDISACNRVKVCPTRGVWNELQNHITEFLNSKTLQDVIDDYKQNEKQFTGMYI